MSNKVFWWTVISGIVVWILGSTIWEVFFAPKLREKGMG